MTIKKGNHVDFVFNSFAKYNGGITLSDWTVIEIFYNDTATAPSTPDPSTKWKLSVNSLTDKIYGDNMTDLELDYLRLTSSGAGTTGIQTLINDIVGDGVDLYTNGAQSGTPVLINITYDCGTEAGWRMLGKEADFYTVDIVFTLTEQ